MPGIYQLLDYDGPHDKEAETNAGRCAPPSAAS